MSSDLKSPQDPLVSFVIPVRNDADNVKRCLAAIRRQAVDATTEFIVVDNGSIDSSRDVARSFGATVLERPGVPVATLRNDGARAARGSLIAFVDADNEICGEWLAAALPHFRDQSVAAVGRDYSAPAKGTWVQRVYDGFRHEPRAIQDIRWLATGNMIVRRCAMLQVGGFDESLETCEDLDFCNQLRLRGYRILSDPRLRSTHFGDPATLMDLFRSELWRGRDSLRVALRGVTAWSELPSVVFPMLAFCGLIAACVGSAVTWHFGPDFLWWPLGSIILVLSLSTLRALRMLARGRDRRPVAAARTWIVAFVYDIARALSLVIRVSHRRAAVASRCTSVPA